MPLTPQEMEAAVIRNLPAKTGRNLEEWVALVQAQAPVEKSSRMDWLKNTHGLGHIQAKIILNVVDTGKSGYAEAGTLMESLFAAENEAAVSLYHDVRRLVASIGQDIKVNVNRSYISFTRHNVFMTLKPAKGVLLIGLSLPEELVNERLVRARFLGTPPRINLQVNVREPSEIDNDLKSLIKKAYEGS